MKKVLLFSSSLTEDKKWANQFAGKDAKVKASFTPDNAPNWSERESMDTGSAPDWTQLVSIVKKASASAGANGVIFFLGGHGVEADATDPNSAWVSLANGGKVKIRPSLVFYSVDPDGKGPSRSPKANDDDSIATADKLKTQEGRNEFLKDNPNKQSGEALIKDLITIGENARKRQKERQFYEQLGQELKSNKVARVVFLSCKIGNETKMIDQISKDWSVEVVAYKQFVTLQEVDGKVLLFLSSERNKLGPQRSIHDSAYIPDITANNAHLATP